MGRKEGNALLRKWADRVKGHPNCIGALLLTAALFVPIVLRFDLYYDLNDDVLIKDILSGVYTGTPEGHAVQLLYPLGLLLSLLYRCLSIPVFGVFLALCQFGSIFAIGLCTARCFSEGQRLQKALALAAEGVFFALAFGWHLVFLQYTVTAGMLAGAGIFWMLTGDVSSEGPASGSAGVFLRRNLPAFLLYWLAFCLRSEMALLLLPLAGAAGLCRWGWEKPVFARENVRKYLLAFAVLLLGLFVCRGMDALAYSGREWQDFLRFFDARTELYDYQMDFVNDYESHAAAYQSAGVSKARQALLENYNFGADDGINTELLCTLSQAAGGLEEGGGLFRKSLREGLWDLLYGHWLNRKDLAFNLVFWALGAAALVGCLFAKRPGLLWQAPLLLAAGGSLWLFLLLRDRPLDRVLHPLYLAQILVFLGLFLLESQKMGKENAFAGFWQQPRGKGAAAFLGAGVLLLVCAAHLPGVFRRVEDEGLRREAVNAQNQAVMEYCSAHRSRLFLEDVYSTVAYSEKIGVDREKPFNYDLLGGWLVKSPLTAQKLEAFGFSSMGEAVRSGGVSLLCSSQTNMEWLKGFFDDQGLALQAVRTGTIDGSTDLYQVLPIAGTETWE